MARPKAGYEANGHPVPGVTTVIGLLDKPALFGWSGKTCTLGGWEAGKRGDPLPRWTELLYPKRDDAATAGTLMHDLIEAHLHGLELPEVPDNEIGQEAIQGYSNFTAWVEQMSIRIVPHERPLVDEELEFGGTPDAISYDRNGRPSLFDWKSGTSTAVYSSMLIQGSAYRRLVKLHDGLDVNGLQVVRFRRDFSGAAHYMFGNDALDEAWEVFRHLLAIYPVLKKVEKRVK